MLANARTARCVELATPRIVAVRNTFFRRDILEQSVQSKRKHEEESQQIRTIQS